MFPKITLTGEFDKKSETISSIPKPFSARGLCNSGKFRDLNSVNFD